MHFHLNVLYCFDVMLKGDDVPVNHLRFGAIKKVTCNIYLCTFLVAP